MICDTEVRNRVFIDKTGKRYTPREWFIAPLDVIEEAIELIISGDIVNFAYDHQDKLVKVVETRRSLSENRRRSEKSAGRGQFFADLRANSSAICRKYAEK
ncbi:MAG: hypothetical protein U9R69_08780 [Thermodesulfobacteriota bacterium]|nr:hypothetical protein [Thermodesulfobacteriota bacterium]